MTCQYCFLTFEDFLSMDGKAHFRYLQDRGVVLDKRNCPTCCTPCKIMEDDGMIMWVCRRRFRTKSKSYDLCLIRNQNIVYTNVKTNMTLDGSPLCDEAHCITAVMVQQSKDIASLKGLHTRTVTILIRLGKRSVKV